MRGDCKCYTQQATLLRTPDDMCRQIVQRGFFVDFKLPERQATARSDFVQRAEQPRERAQSVQPASQPVQVVVAPVQQQDPGAGYLQALAARNAQVRSNLQ
jgi:zona occludens toxin